MVVSDDEVTLEINGTRTQKWYRHDLADNVDFLVGDPEYFREDKSFVTSVLKEQKSELDFQAAAKVDEMIENVRARIEVK
jgi:hypothetical protein